MNDKLIRKLQEEELFPNASPEEVKRRDELRPMFRCPHCKKRVHHLKAYPEVRYTMVNIDSNGHVDMDELSNDEGPFPEGEAMWYFKCPRCDQDVSREVDVS